MGTKAKPDEFDCYDAAADDEPIFVLRARDPLAAELVREWGTRYANRKHDTIRRRYEKETGEDASNLQFRMSERSLRKSTSAYMCANDMDRWRRENPR